MCETEMPILLGIYGDFCDHEWWKTTLYIHVY